MAWYSLHVADTHLVLDYCAELSSAVHLLRAGDLLDILRRGPAGVLIDWTSAAAVSPAQAGQIIELACRYPDLFRAGIAFLLWPEAGDLLALRGWVSELKGVRAEVFADRAAAISWLTGQTLEEAANPVAGRAA